MKMKNKELRGYDGDEIIAQFTIKEYPVVVYGCFSNDTPQNKYEHYDVYIEYSGALNCINEGDPFYSKPKIKDIEQLVQEYLDDLDDEIN